MPATFGDMTPVNCMRRFVERGSDRSSARRLFFTLLPAMCLSRLFQRKQADINVNDVAGLRVNPVLNRVFGWLLDFELALIRLGVCLPAGGSRLLLWPQDGEGCLGNE